MIILLTHRTYGSRGATREAYLGYKNQYDKTWGLGQSSKLSINLYIFYHQEEVQLFVQAI